MAGKQFRGEYVHRMADGTKSATGSGSSKKKTKQKQGRYAPGQGYRPDRKAAKKKKRD
jgi:hypothetical protein